MSRQHRFKHVRDVTVPTGRKRRRKPAAKKTSKRKPASKRKASKRKTARKKR